MNDNFMKCLILEMKNCLQEQNLVKESLNTCTLTNGVSFLAEDDVIYDRRNEPSTNAKNNLSSSSHSANSSPKGQSIRGEFIFLLLYIYH